MTEEKKRIRWIPLLVGMLIAEIVPILIVFALVALFGPPDEAASADYALRVRRMVATIGGTAMAFIVAAKIGRKSSTPVHQGLMLGAGLVILDALLILLGQVPFEWLFLLSSVLKLLGGGFGGALAAANTRYEGRTRA
ncbi:MAG: hypothetical protein WEE89_06470 [Gemmatimonadota bacterium]